MNPEESRLDAPGKAHAPGKIGRKAIAAVPRKKASDAANAVTDGGCGRGEVERPQGPNPGSPALQNQGADAKYQSAEPGKPGRIPQYAPPLLTEFGGRVEHVPHLGSHNAGHNCDGHDADR